MKPISYFPLLIQYIESGLKDVINKPSEVKDGKAFNVLKTNYDPSDNEHYNFVDVIFFKRSGEYYASEKVKWIGGEDCVMDEFRNLLAEHFKGSNRYKGMTAVCINPANINSHPVMINNLFEYLFE